MAVAQENLYAGELTRRRSGYWNKAADKARSFQSRLKRFPREFYYPKEMEVDPGSDEKFDRDYEAEYTRNLAKSRQKTALPGTGDFGTAAEAATQAFQEPRRQAFLRAVNRARKLKEIMKLNGRIPFFFFIITAVISDFGDLSWVLGLMTKGILIYGMLDMGKQRERMETATIKGLAGAVSKYKTRMAQRLAGRTLAKRALKFIFLDCVPLVGALPFSTYIMVSTWRKSVQENEELRIELDNLNKETKRSFGTTIS